MDLQALNYCHQETNISLKQIERTLTLLITEECTVPFVARYRKEVTGNLDETQIRDIQEAYETYLEREKRRAYILDSIKKMEQLTPELQKQIEKAQSLNELEDIYAPYKSKKKTKAMIAKENGLEPLAKDILGSGKTISELEANFKPTDKVKTFAEALEGAKFIMTETIAHNQEIKNDLRDFYQKSACFECSKTKDAEKVKDYLNFKDYFEFSQNYKDLLNEKVSHRFLAINRAKALKVIKFSLGVDTDHCFNIISSHLKVKTGCPEVVEDCKQVAFKTAIHPSIENELFTNLKNFAEETAINVFGKNLKNLLLAPYLGAKNVLAIDPGIRTGCKVVAIDSTGKLLVDHVIFLSQGSDKMVRAKAEIEAMIDAFKIEYICVGDGTYGRETLSFIEENIKQVKSSQVSITMISEAGASVYSASPAAKEEFPDKDVTVRGAISIARRFQDPLSELVKIDPKSIGVGQYQHDLNQLKLKKGLGFVVEDCVNYVGVDLNTASYHILSFISGIGPTVAKNIVKHRQKSGPFKNRKQLLEVSRLSEKVFEQAAGFLRIYDGENPLDSTFVHPERFKEIEQWCKTNGLNLKELVESKENISKFSQDKDLKEKMGELTFNDIVKSLQAPSQDPRTVFKSTEFDKSLKSIEDVKIGAWYTGVVGNITNFGAFVNIGIKESGLVHISQISDTFVENPMDIVKVGQELRVKVIEVDKERGRLSLSCKSDAQVHSSVGKKAKNSQRPEQQKTINNPFGKLKNFKV